MQPLTNGENKNKSGRLIQSACQKKNYLQMLPPIYQEANPIVFVPVSFISLPTIINEVWNSMETMKKIDVASFQRLNTEENKNIFKKVMLVLAEAKVCCAQRAVFPLKITVDLPQREQYFYHELLELNKLVEHLPYPLALYLDCLGNTVEGRLHVTPVLAKLKNTDIPIAISGAPLQLFTLLKTKTVQSDYKCIIDKLHAHPNFKFENCGSGNYIVTTATEQSWNFWLTPNGRINLSEGDRKIFQDIISCFKDTNFNSKTDILKGEGRMAQTVQTPNWLMDDPIQYHCMTDISEYDQKLGATFGFSFTGGLTVEDSRYTSTSKTSYWKGEAIPRRMLHSMFDENLW